MTASLDAQPRGIVRSWPVRLLLVLALALAGLVLPTPPAAQAAGTPGPFISLPPARILDTRTGNGATGPVGADATVHLQVSGRGGVPASGVAAVVLTITVTAPADAGFLTVYPDGTSLPNASTVNFVAGRTVPNLVVVKLSSAGKVAITNSSHGTAQVVADVSGYYLQGTPDAAGAFMPMSPSRILDTRSKNGASGPVAANSTVHLQVSGRGGVPSTGVAAVVVNVTVTQPQRGGYVTAYPDGTTRPTASNVNFAPDATVANLVTVELSSSGRIALTNTSGGTVQLVGDVEGYFLNGWASAPGAFVPLSPARLLDTRTGNGATGPVAAHSTVHLQVTGRGHVPSSGVAAVVLNVTVTQPQRQGYLTAFPDGGSRPNASNVNFMPDETVADLVVVKVSPAGKVAITNTSSGTVQIVGDVAGYYLTAVPGAFVPLTPARVLDTRKGNGAAGPVASHSTVHLQVSGRGGVPLTGVSAVALNVTVTSPTTQGYLTVYPDATALPNASNVNFMPGATVPALVVVKLSSAGKVAITNTSGGTVQIVADVSGYYLAGKPTAPGAFSSLSPSRILDTRTGNGAGGAVAAGATVHLQVSGRGGVPATGAGSVILNVTVTEQQRGGYLTVYPDGNSKPNASNVNFNATTTVANLVVVKLSAAGKVAITNSSSGTVQIVADVSGYHLAGTPDAPGAVASLAPSRILDTRKSTGAPGPVPSGATVRLQVTGRGGVPASGVTAVVLNVTVTEPGGGGYLRVYPDSATLPAVSNVNFAAGETVANLVMVKVSPAGRVAITNTSGGTVQIVADVSGYVIAANAAVGPMPPLPASAYPATPVSLSDGGAHSCAVTAGGSVKCWGWNYTGQLGNATTTDSAAPVTVSGLSSGGTRVSAGRTSTCVLTTGGAVRCFGDNSTGIVGPSAGAQSSVPMTILGSGVKQVSVGSVAACALTTSGGVKCWGDNYRGTLGNGSTADSYTPVNVSGLSSGVKQIAVGGSHACAITSSSTVVCWGANDYGQLGDGSYTNRSKPVTTKGLSGVSAITASIGTTCAITGGAVKCWGENDQGQLGNGTTTASTTPVQVSGLTSGYKAADLGLLGGCALSTGGAEKCWGGDVGTSAGHSTKPVTTFSSGIAGVSVGDDHSCALLTTGTLKCWGDNSMKQLGNQTTVAYATTPVPGPKFV